MEPKPCPFCGAKLVCKEEIWRLDNLTKKWPVYMHPEKGCVLDYLRLHFYARPEKLEAWNRRANVEDAPAVDAVPVRRGQWIKQGEVVVCSECGEEHAWIDYRSSFCEDCGADMRESNERFYASEDY